MNKTLSSIALGLSALMALSLSSCTSEDQDTAYYLAGEWDGYIYDGSDEYAATFYFEQENDFATYGTGWETDRGWYDYSQEPFHWWVSNGEIFIQYDGYSNRRVVLDGNIPLSRDDDYMRGYFVDDITGETLAEYQLSQTYGNSKQTEYEDNNNN
ncbi:MAG: hypothetical protein ACOYJG_03055 [Prevotella sp.]|jgi:hypothetical protein